MIDGADVDQSLGPGMDNSSWLALLVAVGNSY